MTFSKMTKSKHVPLRSCSVCRVRGSKNDLIRVVKSPEGRSVIDIAGKLPGRGAYICPDSECIDKGRKSGALARALGLGEIATDFWAELEDHAKNFTVNTNMKLRSLLGLSRKAGALLIGVDGIKASHHKSLLLLADDASDSVRRFAENYRTLTPGISVQELSEAAGSHGSVQVVGLPMSSGFAKKILTLTQCQNFEGRTAFE